MTYYTTSRYANYVHLHMYIFFNELMWELKEKKLDYDGAYDVNVEIDGNIATWRMEFYDPRARYVFDTLRVRNDFITTKTIKAAARDIAKKLGRKYEMTDSERVIREIGEISFLDKKPNINDNDLLVAPGINFI